MKDDNRICANCVFYVGEPSANSGHCHRYPPTTRTILFPTVLKDSWCGEFKAGNR